ncbi:hypothetical protein HanRHA438_Chr10g0453111 [Helianthus annuus]|nr:hypothetical protein HanRHA438_Chr10g0453111 [Helianthus annuus]
MRISFIVANIDTFHFLVNPHVTHALFVAHVVHLSYEDHRRASFQFIVLLKVQISFRYTRSLHCKPRFYKAMTL